MFSKPFFLVSAASAGALLAYMYWESLGYLFNHWIESEDYSHGLLVPVVSAGLVWQSRDRVLQGARVHARWGLVVMALGLVLYVVGEVATLYVVLHISLWAVIVGLVMTVVGVSGARVMIFPLCYLLTAIPLPVFLYAKLSSQLQLWSSALGVKLLQMVGVMAFREGNVIDLGPVQLQVVEACSGIRYLLPLLALALLCAYLFKDRMWKRVVLVLSSIPISILVNGFRIGSIGVLVEWQGQGAAEGFSHLFEGWVLFMVSLGMLILEAWLLAHIGMRGGHQGAFLERFTWVDSYERPVMPQVDRTPTVSLASPTYLYGVALLVPFALISATLTERQEAPPVRDTFIDFPMQVSHWKGSALPLEKQYIDALKFDDYVLADYRVDQQQPVNFYVAYYRSQKKGQSAHSPQSCLPGGGWEIQSLTPATWSSSIGKPLHANRVVIQKGDQRQIVYYWFKQRDRLLTSEYLVKWYLLWDAFARQRTDGALVRLASPLGPRDSEKEVDQRLMTFASAVEQPLLRFVPD